MLDGYGLIAVMWRLRYRHRFGDVAQFLLRRGYQLTRETIRCWEFRFAQLPTDRLRRNRPGRAGVSWYLCETCEKVAGQWRYLYHAIDREGHLLDSMLSARCYKHAARRFLRRPIENVGRKPLRVTTDQHLPYRRAIRWILGWKIFAAAETLAEHPH